MATKLTAERAEYMRNYATNYKQVKIMLRKDSDEDMEIFDWLDKRPSKSEYLKNLIQRDMEKDNR
jgi:hypothetical protein